MFEIRPVASLDECRRAIFAIGQYFTGAPPDKERLERFVRLMPFERLHAAFEDGDVVGGAGVFAFDFSVPGASLPCAGVTVVGVYPTHRRRGIMRELMKAQLRDVHERGEPIAALWASEETIYGRFGYGLASWIGEMTIKAERSAFALPLERRGKVRFVTPEEALELFPPVLEALHRQRPGVVLRTREWWQLRTLRILDEEKANPRRFVVLELDGEVQGYAMFRIHSGFVDGISSARTEVKEAIGATPQATAELWRFLLDIDWQATFEVALVPPDHPLFLLLAQPRPAGYRLGDGLWVRLVDVGAALSGRRYGGEGAIVFDVRDAVCPWNEGRWKLEAGAASRTDDPADIACDVNALGSAYLGAVSFSQLRDALRLEEVADGAVERADVLFGWLPLPWCPEIF